MTAQGPVRAPYSNFLQIARPTNKIDSRAAQAAHQGCDVQAASASNAQSRASAEDTPT